MSLLYGHRGAPGAGCVEKTMASFQRALDDGANALETDVHRTSDGHVVVCHVPTVRGRPINGSTLAELRSIDLGNGERVPLLRDVLDRFRDVRVNVDVKQRAPRMERDVVDAIGADAARVLLASFHVDVLGALRALPYRGELGLSKTEVARLVATPAATARLLKLVGGVRGQRAQVPVNSGRWRFDTAAFIAKCHAVGVAVDYWVINDVDEARRLLALGADGIMSDAPAGVKPAFAG